MFGLVRESSTVIHFPHPGETEKKFPRSRGSCTPQRQGAGSCVKKNWINRSLELFHLEALSVLIVFYNEAYFSVIPWRCSKKQPSKRWLLLLFGPWTCECWVVPFVGGQFISNHKQIREVLRTKLFVGVPQRLAKSVGVGGQITGEWWGLSSVPCGPRLLAFLREHRCAGRQATRLHFRELLLAHQLEFSNQKYLCAFIQVHISMASKWHQKIYNI